MNSVATSLGYYPETTSPKNYGLVMGHSFGTSVEPGSVNHQTAEVVCAYAGPEGPIAVDRTLANAFTKDMRRPDYVVEGAISDARGQGIGVAGTIVDTKEHYVDPNSIDLTLQIAQVNFIGRILRQAAWYGVPSIAPPAANLPHGFDSKSDQLWTRRLAFWIPREIIGTPILRKKARDYHQAQPARPSL